MKILKKTKLKRKNLNKKVAKKNKTGRARKGKKSQTTKSE